MRKQRATKLSAMSLLAKFNLFLVSIAFFSTSYAVGESSSLTAYEILQGYDFPVGLLPKGVKSYEFDESTGKFTVYYEKFCSFTIDGYNLGYKSRITGVIRKDRLSNLNGVQVKILFIWVNIGEVTRDGDQLEFSVGIVSAEFPVDNFYESPQCGCGFDCNGGRRKVDLKRLVSSS